MNLFKSTGKMSLTADEMKNNECFVSASAGTEKTLASIKQYWEEQNYLMDPHTAVGVSVAENLNLETKTVCLSTAHPAKFPDAIVDATGKDLAKHPTLEALKGAKTRCETLPADKSAIQAFLTKNAV